MDLAQFIIPAAGAFVVACLICWLMWRWRQHAVPVDEWSRLERRRRLLEGENLRLQDRVELLGQQNEEFPSLRAAISDRDDQIMALEHAVGIAQAREIGIATRLDQFGADLSDANARERQLEDEVLSLRQTNAEITARIEAQEAEHIHNDLLTPSPSFSQTTSLPSDLTQIENLEQQLAQAVARADDLEAAAETSTRIPLTTDTSAFVDAGPTRSVGARESEAELAAASERIASLEHQLSVAIDQSQHLTARESELTKMVAEADLRIDKMVIDLREQASSQAEVTRLSTMSTNRESEVLDLQTKITKLSSRADASAILAAELRSRLDSQLVQNGHLEQQLHSQS